MGYTETINCPHCHESIELEVDVEASGDDAYAVIKPIERENEMKATACVNRWRHACSSPPQAPTST